jgi:hypothetical protein
LDAILFAVATVAIVLAVFVLGPICLAFDINHIAPLITTGFKGVNWYNPVVFIGGVLLSETVIPIAIALWVCVAVGLVP